MVISAAAPKAAVEASAAIVVADWTLEAALETAADFTPETTPLVAFPRCSLAVRAMRLRVDQRCGRGTGPMGSGQASLVASKTIAHSVRSSLASWISCWYGSWGELAWVNVIFNLPPLSEVDRIGTYHTVLGFFLLCSDPLFPVDD
jgi:hypothetical protein